MTVIYPLQPGVRVTSPFLDPDYPKFRISAGLPVAEHPGVDYGHPKLRGDQARGFPVVAFAEGEVIHVGNHRVWGNIVALRHDLLAEYLKLDHPLVSLYAHLAFTSVEVGDYLLAGQPVGSMGAGDPMFRMVTHLHFEIRKDDKLKPDFWPGANKNLILEKYLDPHEFIKNHYQKENVFYRKQVIILNQPSDAGGLINIQNKNKAYVRYLKN